MMNLSKLIQEIEDVHWKRWVDSMVQTFIEQSGGSTDPGEAYDIIKTNFRSDAPSRDVFNKASREAMEILRQMGKIR